MRLLAKAGNQTPAPQQESPRTLRGSCLPTATLRNTGATTVTASAAPLQTGGGPVRGDTFGDPPALPQPVPPPSHSGALAARASLSPRLLRSGSYLYLDAGSTIEMLLTVPQDTSKVAVVPPLP
jgi:hypothetical protein